MLVCYSIIQLSASAAAHVFWLPLVITTYHDFRQEHMLAKAWIVDFGNFLSNLCFWAWLAATSALPVPGSAYLLPQTVSFAPFECVC